MKRGFVKQGKVNKRVSAILTRGSRMSVIKVRQGLSTLSGDEQRARAVVQEKCATLPSIFLSS